jgi:dTDP-4-dehydrorhamnose reductase
MVIGNGSLATVFFDEFNSNDEILIFASGVSDSTENKEENFNREKNLLSETIKNNYEKKIVYFSSILVGFKETKYYSHKLEMENLISTTCKNFLIIRLPQVVGEKGNKKNIVNFFIECLINEEKTIIFSDSWRSIIGVDDVFKLSKELIFNHNNKVLKFSNIETISVVDLYKRICKIINKKENFELSDYQEKIPSIDNSQEVIDILKKLNIITENYTDKILTKYLKKWSY